MVAFEPGRAEVTIELASNAGGAGSPLVQVTPE